MPNLIPSWLSLPLLVLLYRPLSRLLPGMDKDAYVRRTVAAGNRFYARRFRKVPYSRRLLFLPYCLRAQGCPTEIDPREGLTCPSHCLLPCPLRRLQALALELGYQRAFIVVSGRLHREEGVLRSRNFLVGQIERYQPQGVVGCLCTRDLREKYLKPETIAYSGTLGREGVTVIPQVCLLENSNCRQSAVNLRKLEEMIRSQD
ncbi:DUF116 domain-containing protein [Desulfurivibrio sp. D14AmB]|uniref:DUF116 domain-containing protein n=1 Tax=Desulfurivibrio sp. D14AmB TaxID=3374370 RepID=UPI00376ED403